MARVDAIFLGGPVTLHHGDALEVLPTLEPESFDVIFCDWPYSTMQPVRGKDVGSAGRIFGANTFLREVLGALHRVAARGAHLYVFGDWRGIADTGYTMSTTGWFPTTIIAWDKCYVGTGGFWRSSWDPIFFASKGPAQSRTERAHANVIRTPSVRGRGDHPAEKPGALWERLCEVSVSDGARVLDPFAGSSSSRAPVETRGGVWTGIDVDRRWGRR